MINLSDLFYTLGGLIMAWILQFLFGEGNQGG